VPTEAERELLAVLLGADFAGKPALLAQAVMARVKTIDSDGSLRFLVDEQRGAIVARRIPVEAEVEDSDGVMIHVLLHVVGGRLDELEVYRNDSAPVMAPIRPNSLRVLVL